MRPALRKPRGTVLLASQAGITGSPIFGKLTTSGGSAGGFDSQVTNATELVAAANNIANAGKTIAMRGGNYGDVALNSTVLTSQCVFQAYPGETVQFGVLTLRCKNVTIRGAYITRLMFGNYYTNTGQNAVNVRVEYCDVNTTFFCPGVVALNTTLYRCKFHDNDHTFIEDQVLVHGCDGLLIEECEFYNQIPPVGSSHYDCFQVTALNGTCKDITLRRNWFHDNDSSGIIIIKDGSITGTTTVEYNLMDAYSASVSGGGSWTIGNTTNLIVRRNTTWQSTSYGFLWVAGNGAWSFTGNVDRRPGRDDVGDPEATFEAGMVACQDNVIWTGHPTTSTGAWATVPGTNNQFVADAPATLFADTANHDWRLKAGQPNYGLAGVDWTPNDWVRGPAGVAAGATVPAAPTGVSATAGNAQAVVSYTLGSAGSSSTDQARATSSPGGFTGTTPVGSPTGPITVSGLTNGTPYTFTVAAHNASGWSVESSPSGAVTPSTGGSAEVSTTTQLNTAITSAGSAGQTITIRGGTYSPNVINTAQASMVTFRAAAGEQVTINSLQFNSSAKNFTFQGVNCPSVSIYDLASNIELHYSKLRNIVVAQSVTGLPTSTVPSNLRFYRCDINAQGLTAPYSGGEDMFNVHGFNGVIVEECELHHWMQDPAGAAGQHNDVCGYYCTTSGTTTNLSQNWIWRRNYIHDIACEGMLMKDFKITGEVWYDENLWINSAGGIGSFHYVLDITKVTFTRNTLWGSWVDILFGSSNNYNNVTATGNVVKRWDVTSNTYYSANLISQTNNVVVGSNSNGWVARGTDASVANSTAIFVNPITSGAGMDWRLKNTSPNFGNAGITWAPGDWSVGPAGVGAL